jgi:anti-sigma factor RsiW
MSTAGHPVERLVDLVDDRLNVAEAAEVRRHVADCAACRLELEWIAAGRSAARAARRTDTAPADVRARLTSALDDLDAAAASPRPARISRRAVWTGLAAAAGLVLYLMGPWRGRTADAVDRARAEYLSVRGNAAALTRRTSDAVALERYFNEPADGPRIRVIDLGMMGWTLEGGAQRRSGSVPVALYAYRSSAGADLVCQMYPGVLADLPAAGAVRQENGFEFRVYTRDGVTLVFWQEGALVCVLAAELPAAEVVALAIAKAMIPA